MNQATKLAEERAAAMEKAMREFEERARAEEAERQLRQQMFELAAGPIGTGRNNPGESARRTPRAMRFAGLYLTNLAFNPDLFLSLT